jgi:hypothetical protein
MRIATSTVSFDGYRNPATASFEATLETLRETLDEAKHKGVQLLCLPGGYFTVKSEAQLKKAAKRIVAEARKAHIAVAVGVDCADKQSTKRKSKRQPNRDNLIRKGKLPLFAVAWSPEQSKQETWRQRSVTSKDQWLAPAKSCSEPRTLRVAGKKIEILMCGELFNERIRDGVIRRKPTALVDLSHNGQGFRPDHALRSLAQAGLHALRQL